MTLRREKIWDFVARPSLTVVCQSKISEEYLSERVDRSESTQKPFEDNVRSVFAFRGIGCGYNAIKDWASMMNLPNSPSKDAYATVKDKLFIGSGKAFEEVATKYVEVIKDKYKKIGTLPDCNGIVDIAVSYDGVGAVIDVLTGLPIDYGVLCNFSHQCLKVQMTPTMQSGKKTIPPRIMMEQPIQWSRNEQRGYGIVL